jgi:hypothetical protein
MKKVLSLFAFMLFSCGAMLQTGTQIQNEGKCPTFRDGTISFDTFIFCDTTIYARTFSDLGGFQSENFIIGNWKVTNDSTLEIYHVRKRWLEGIKFLYINRLNSELQLLVPDRSTQVYHETLKLQVLEIIKARPYLPNDEEQMLIDTDSVKFYPRLMSEHYKGVLYSHFQKFDELDILRGRGF